MGYRNLRQAINDLERTGQLFRVKAEVDPNLEMAEIQRRVYAAQGPAVFFEKVKGSPFPAVSNLFGTIERSRFLFRDTLKKIERVMELRIDPSRAMKKPFRYLPVAFTGLKALPMKKWGSAAVMQSETTMNKLPLIKSWPMDGGPFITLPQVYTEDIDQPGVMKSNLGMYRVQMMGNDYETNKEIGLHYQIHRGIGVHHSKANAKKQPLRVSIFVGGPPSHTFSAVMPLPEGLSELLFAGMLGGKRFKYKRWNEHLISAEADFCIVGTIEGNKTKPEGPFGDHLGYYSLAHEYPVMKVEKVFHRKDAVWPFTVVGRPPQEDTSFGKLIHEITGPVVATEIPGIHSIHAVDAAGVHPLLLAIGSERYVPFGERKPMELLTQSNAILGFGQASLAKYLFIAANEDAPPEIHDIGKFIIHILERFNPEWDLHFQTRTTIDTLDYSGMGINSGSKLVIAAAGNKKRELLNEIPSGLKLPDSFSNPKVALPGVLIIQGPKWMPSPFDYAQGAAQSPSKGEDPRASEEQKRMEEFCRAMNETQFPEGFPLIVVVDDSEFTARNLNNFLWVTFTRSNPSHDVFGIGSFTEQKHWGCRKALVIDARIKTHHAPPLIEDAGVSKRVEEMAAKGGALEGLF